MLFIKSLNRNFCFHFRRKIIGKFYFLRPEKGPRSSIFPRKNVKFTCLYCRYLVLQISCLYCRYLVCTADILSHKAYWVPIDTGIQWQYLHPRIDNRILLSDQIWKPQNNIFLPETFFRGKYLTEIPVSARNFRPGIPVSGLFLAESLETLDFCKGLMLFWTI